MKPSTPSSPSSAGAQAPSRRRERLLAWAVAAVLLALSATTQVFVPLERRAYDAALADAARPGSAEVVIVAVDEASLAARGPWPWTRELLAQLTDRLREAGARTIVHAEPLLGQESGRALAQWQRLVTTVAGDPALAHHPDLPVALSEGRDALDADGRLAQSMARQGRTLLALGELPAPSPVPAPRAGLAMAGDPEHLLRQSPPAAGRGLARPTPWPVPELASSAWALGHFERGADEDGHLRHHPVRREVDGQPVLSLAVLAAAAQRGIEPSVWRAAAPHQLALGRQTVALDAQGRLSPIFATPRPGQSGWPRLSADAVLEGRFAAPSVAGRLVLVGRTAGEARLMGGLGPDGERLAPVETLAHLSSALLTGQALAQPSWAAWMPGALLLGVLAYLAWAVPRLTPGSGLVVSGLVAVCLLLASHLALSAGHVWVPTMLPVAALVLGHLAMLALRHRVQAAHVMAVAPVAPLAPLAPLSILVPDVQVDTLAHAGASAASAPLPATPALDEPTQMLPVPLVIDEAPVATVPSRPADELPGPVQLGRYRLEHEIGRGAMGRVYAARVPGVSTEFAVKTLALGREFDGYALREALERFRREAQTAARLDHPDIVRVHEAGEQQGLAYLVMERVHGRDLSHHTDPGTLLPLKTVVAVGARVAKVLAHAHAQGIIHRDIKPANVMIDRERGRLKVTDFGIARITDAARTRTGVVLGSPSYMAPEQLLGRAVDGRSDLYSLGVLLFQLLTGALPVQGDSLAELIRNVTHGKVPDLRALRPDLPAALCDIIGILLQKRPELRYRDGHQVAADLRLVGAALATGKPAAGAARVAGDASVQDCAPSRGADDPATPPGTDRTRHNRWTDSWTAPLPRS